MLDNPSLQLLGQWRDHADQGAAQELFYRYADRLVALARKRLPARMSRRVDADDLVQSACRTFFVRVRDGRLDVRPDGSLWQLLAAITMKKVLGQLEHHEAGKRSMRREQEPAPEGSISLPLTEALARDPDPAEVTALQEQLELLLGTLKPLHRQMIELRLQGCTQPEIAEQTGRTERMVRLVLTDFAKRLQAQMES